MHYISSIELIHLIIENLYLLTTSTISPKPLLLATNNPPSVSMSFFFLAESTDRQTNRHCPGVFLPAAEMEAVLRHGSLGALGGNRMGLITLCDHSWVLDHTIAVTSPGTIPNQ